jgi:S1-C subfamily serine protease
VCSIASLAYCLPMLPEVARSWLGIQFQSVLPEITDSVESAEWPGILVADVHPAAPAAKAGIAAGDLMDSVS